MEIERGSDDIYVDELKRNAIKNYILATNGEFDYEDLAELMGMTFMQLRKYLIRMKVRGDIIIEEGCLSVKEDYYHRFCNELSYDYKIKCDKILDADKYVPKDFQKNFKGYT